IPNPEIEFLNALGLFDPPEIAETIPSPEAKREYFEALGILEPIPQFYQTDIISSGCELLDDHYKVEIEKESIYAQDPINTLGVLREQIINIFNNQFNFTHGFKTRLCLRGKMSRSANYQQGLFDDKIEEDNGEKDYKEVPFKNKAVVVTAKEDIPRIVDELIWDIENRIETYIVDGSGWVYEVSEEVNIEMPIFVPLAASSHLLLPKGIPKRNNGIINIKNEDNRCFERCILEDLYPAPYHRERPQNQNPYLDKLNFKGIQFPSKKELIPIRIASKSKVHDRCNHKEENCQPHKLIRLLLITGDDPETGEPSQHYCLIQRREGLGKLAGYTTKHNRRLYICDYCVSHRTHDPKIDAQHMKDCEGINTPVQRTVMPLEADAETLSTLIEKNQGSQTKAIQEYKVISFDYIIRRSDSKTKVPVKIRGNDPAGEFIKAIEKEVEQYQDFLAGGHIIRNSAKKLIKILQSGIIPEEIVENYITSINIFQSWKLGKINLNFSKEYEKLIHLKDYLKGLYQAHKRDPLGVDIGIMYRLANTIYSMGQVSREKISAIPHNMESYFTLDIGNQRYMDSLQLMPGSLDSHISNLGAEPCKEEVDKDGNSLNLPCKKPSHLYRIDLDRCFAHLEKFPITREHGPKGKDDLVFSDCLEGFRKLMKGKFGLDIAHYVSLPSFAEDALYKTTGQEIELFTDDNIKRQVKANNPQCPDFVPETEEAMKKLYIWLLYVDANALYTGAMMQSMPTGGHRWITAEETSDLFNKITKCEIPDNAEKGYILEVDLDYPYKLHKAHTSYPLAPENIEISKDEMSKYGQEIINDLKHYTKTKKLVPNLNNKKKPERESKKFKKLVADPSYKSHRILAENLVALGKEKIILNKKVPGKFKDESCGTTIWKFCGPRPKLYSYILADGKTDQRAKGVQKVVVKKNLTHDMYEDCLKSQKECMVTIHRLGSKDHIIRLLRSSKV
ncbi:360_t:CDS:2, partial [Gigaspora rosea]